MNCCDIKNEIKGLQVEKGGSEVACIAEWDIWSNKPNRESDWSAGDYVPLEDLERWECLLGVEQTNAFEPYDSSLQDSDRLEIKDVLA